MTDQTDLKDIGQTEDLQAGSTLQVPIGREMKKSYLDYAMSVIVSRALPDVRDGLKPVHRRIIYAAKEINLTADSKYRKSATLVGDVMGKYHPHGNEAIYESLVRMAQDFSLRYPLIDGQGNWGTIDGDPAAAMRYTECRMERISDYLVQDIDQDTVDFVDNFSAEHKEPTVLPAVIPNLLMNGASGIAVGMATNIPPHNLSELIDGINLIFDRSEVKENAAEKHIIRAYDLIETEAVVKNWQIDNNVKLEELVKIIKGPDFPTGGVIYDQSETLKYFATGRGRIVQRAKATIEEEKGGKFSIVVTEIPFMVNKAAMIEKIASLVQLKKVKDISAIKDISNKNKLKVVIELKREARPQKVLNLLYKYSPLQTAFNANMLALVNGRPELLGLKQFLDEFIKHRKAVVTRRTLYLLRKAREREHILEGLKKALDIIDEIIAMIRKSKDTDDAKTNLVKKFKFTEIQAQAILDMQLRRLAALERQKIEDELKEIQKNIKQYLAILSSPKEMIKVIRDELAMIKEKFGDDRKTKVIKGKVGEFEEEDLIENEQTLIAVTESGYIKRLKPSVYKTQGRGGKGVVGMKTKEEDEVSMLRMADTHDRILFLTDKGKAYEKRVWDIPESARTAKGTAIVNLIDMSSSEKLEEVISISKAEEDNKNNLYILMATKNGSVKKTSLSEFDNIRKTGIIAIGLNDGDEVVRATLTDGSNDVLLVTSEGQSIRFKEDDVRPMGRSASGVRGIKLKGKDYLVSMETLSDDNGKLLFITQNGYGKTTKSGEYSPQTRGGSGVIGSKVSEKTGKIVAVKALTSEIKDVLLTSESGQVIRIPAKDVPVLGRPTQGVILMRLRSDDKVSAVSVMQDEPEIDDAAQPAQINS